MGERFKDINMSNRLTAEDLVEVSLGHEEDFLKVKETLTRMGVSSRKEKKLYQSCHIPNNISEGDIARRNMIISLLEEWELIKIVDINKCEEPMASLGQIKIIPHRDKDEWELIPKYHIGNKR